MEKSPFNILPKNKYGINGPEGDLLHWDLSWSFFIFPLYQMGGALAKSALVYQGFTFFIFVHFNFQNSYLYIYY